MTEKSTNLKLPYILPSQAQKHITHNEAIRMLDAQIQIAVDAASLASPPASPAEGNRYLIGTAATGLWSGKENQIAAWQDGAWSYFEPVQGWLVYVGNENLIYVFNGSDWITPDISTDNLARIGVNTNADGYNKVAVKSDAVLVSHDDVTPGTGDARLTINKSGAGNVASIELKSGFSGKAELGLIGNDAFAIRYDLPSAGWKSLIHFDENTGDGRFFGNVVIDTQGTPNIAKLQTFTHNQRSQLQFYNSPTGEYWEIAGEFGSGKELKFISSDGSVSSVPFTIEQNASNHSIYVTASGNIGIGKPPSGPKLDVDGAVRPGSYSVTALPSPSGQGAGAIIFVSDESGGATLAFSDGADWRRVSDRVVVS